MDAESAHKSEKDGGSFSSLSLRHCIHPTTLQIFPLSSIFSVLSLSKSHTPHGKVGTVAIQPFDAIVPLSLVRAKPPRQWEKAGYSSEMGR